MTDYTWPTTVVPTSGSLTWQPNTREFTSTLSNTVRTESVSGGRWAMSMLIQNLKNLTGADDPLHELEAFIFRLDGKTHRAVIKDYGYLRSGPGGGDPRVDGASQTGLSLNTYGWPNSTTVLYAGDRIGVSNQMIPVAADVTSNATGLATITLAHAIRTAPANTSQIEIDDPTARYILSNFASVASFPGIFKTAQVEFIEDINT